MAAPLPCGGAALLLPDMPRYFFTCAYDGAAYLGWQSQRGGGTLQDCIEEACAAVLHTPLRIHAAGRTDAGVHARAQCFHADVPESCRMSADNWLAALNAHLPGDIRIVRAEAVPIDWHARFSACGKIYDYLICCDPVLSPFLRARAWHCPRSIGDRELLRAALHEYIGTHDFRRFAARRGNEPAVPPPDFYRRTLRRAELGEEGGLLRLRFCGDGFMYRMVRMLVGSAVQVSLGKMRVETLREMLQQPEGAKTRFCAPAAGLYLHAVLYPELPHPAQGGAGH